MFIICCILLKFIKTIFQINMDGSAQDYGNSSANALELP